MGRACWRKQSQKVGFGVCTSPHLLLSAFHLPVWMKCDQPASCRCHTTPCIPHAYGPSPSGASRQNKLFLKLLLVMTLYLSKRRMITQYTYVNTWKCLMQGDVLKCFVTRLDLGFTDGHLFLFESPSQISSPNHPQ